ncbi:hypothetical protein [Bradyrhizobium sp. McL0616]|uniref:hypothetical protein n=1 Tax=Bradyrhizobium sp. McL0616 TaxID=3415674 RepID=UPI003CEB70D1
MANPKMFERVPADAGFDQLSGGPALGLSVLAIGDAIDALPGEASKERLRALRQRSQDARSVYLPISDQVRETRTDLQKAQGRLKHLTLARMAGGFGLSEGTANEPADPQVADIKRVIERLQGEMQRLGALEQSRGAALQNVGMLVRRAEDWLRQGRAGTKLVEVAPVEVSDILKKNETRLAALTRIQFRLRELDADRHRVMSAPVPSKDAKAKAHAEITALADRGMPLVEGLIEYPDGRLGWPMTTMRLPLGAAIVGKTGDRLVGDATGELPDVIALVAWLLRPQLLKAVNDLLDASADDSTALSASDRDAKVIEIAADKLATERIQAALIWAMQSSGDAVEHPSDADVAAVLSVELAARS